MASLVAITASHTNVAVLTFAVQEVTSAEIIRRRGPYQHTAIL